MSSRYPQFSMPGWRYRIWYYCITFRSDDSQDNCYLFRHVGDLVSFEIGRYAFGVPGPRFNILVKLLDSTVNLDYYYYLLLLLLFIFYID